MDYAGLLAAIASYTKRGDTAALAPTWVTLTESKMNRELRSYLQLATAVLSIATVTTAAPADMAAARSARLTTGRLWLLDQLSAEQMADRQQMKISGSVSAFAAIGGSLVFDPQPGTADAIELLYYANLPALSATTTTNKVLAKYPDLYLFGALTEASDYYEDDEQLQKYAARFVDVLRGANADSVRYEAGANLTPSPGAQPI